MGTFYLNDETIEFEPGDTVLAAALRAGREIPHYCYHPGLAVTAQCRQCLVEITDMGNGRGMPRLQASCSTPASEGMKLTSDSELARWGQNLVNEFLLVNHPLDCPICDQAGECTLQNYAFEYGSGRSEMEYEKRVFGWRDVGSFIMLERNRCVQCSRCERFSKDIVGTHDFGAFLRGHELTFDTWEDHAIAHKYQGNLADLCPVGAITNRDWRFKKRAWMLQATSTVCTGCSTGCNVTLEHHQNRVYRIKPRENTEVNRWWMCDEGRIGFRHFNDRRTRLLEPTAKVGGKHSPAGWDAAFAALAKRADEIGATGNQVVAITDTHATNEELFLLTRLMKQGFDSEAVFFPYRAGKQQEHAPARLEDPFIYTLLNTDRTPNMAGAQRLGLQGSEDDSALKKALGAKPKVVLVLGQPFADDGAMRKAVGKAELIVHVANFTGPWSEAADVVLPGYTLAEKDGTLVNKDGRVQRVRAGLRAPEGVREQVRILGELLSALGKAEGYPSVEETFAALTEQSAGFAGVTWDDVGEAGVSLPSG